MPKPAKLDVQRIFNSPVEFAKHILRDDPWAIPVQMFRALAEPNARVAVKGCHSSSKTYSAAEFILWFLMLYHHSAIVVTSAPTQDQAEDIMWGEIHKARMRANFDLGFAVANQIELRMPDVGNHKGSYAIGRVTNKANQAVAFQGYHDEHVLFVLDEAPGIPPEILNAIEGTSASGDVRVLMLGNPTIPSGAFYDAFTANRNRWRCFSVDAFDTPNFNLLQEMAKHDYDGMRELLAALPIDHPAIQSKERPYLATPLWARERLLEWGVTSPLWQARVRAQFPEQAEDSLIGLVWLEAARNRPVAQTTHRFNVGIDVAGPGEDETVCVIRDGPSIVGWRTWHQQDPRGEVAAYLNPYRGRIDELNIDSAGIGHYFATFFEEDLGFPVNFVNVGEASPDSDHFVNLKAQLYWGLRQRFEAGDVAGLTDDLTISQLASIRYRHNSRGQVVIESKEDARKRGVRSPDRAEAVMLAFADRTPGIMQYMHDRAAEYAFSDQIPTLENPAVPAFEEPDYGDLAEIYERELRRLREEDS